MLQDSAGGFWLSKARYNALFCLPAT